METKLNYQHQVFINEIVEHGDRIRAYRKAYPDAGTSAYNSAYRLSRQPDIVARIEEIKKQKELEELERAEAEYYAILLGMEKKRAILAKILNGEMKFDKIVQGPAGPTTMKVEPTATEICRVIETDNNLAKEISAVRAKLPIKFFIDGEEFT